VIISFLAMLELVKQQHVRLSQSKLFEDIFIEKI
jgi:chromatin segregation and condensation protein Rec8/ScpA/Scc1 (kleisin family)